MNGTNPVQEQIDELAEEFAELDPRERLEILLDYAATFPAFPGEFQERMQSGDCRVQECMTPVHLWIGVKDGRLKMYAHVAEEGPTVKGFVGLMLAIYDGATPQQVLAAEADVLSRLQLIETLGMNRLRGLNAVVQRIQGEAARLASEPD